jgi:hypothetical protein
MNYLEIYLTKLEGFLLSIQDFISQDLIPSCFVETPLNENEIDKNF